MTRVKPRNTRDEFTGMGGDLRVFFRGKHTDQTARRWSTDGVFQRLISCRVEGELEAPVECVVEQEANAAVIVKAVVPLHVAREHLGVVELGA